MTTPFQLILARCGLSHREAAAFLCVRLDTVKSWSAGRNPTPAPVLTELRVLYGRIERTAAEAQAQIEAIHRVAPAPDVLEFGLAADDTEAQRLGWPCVGAQAALLGLLAARLPWPVRIVPRASTIATAAAADQTDLGATHGAPGP